MLIPVYQNNISKNQLLSIVKSLQEGNICIIPTDTLYAFVCDINNRKAAKNLALLKNKTLEKSNFSLLCSSLSMASQYIKPLTDNQFRVIKNSSFEYFTFILEASNSVPKIFQSKRRTVGIRIVKNDIARQIIETTGNPLLVSSVPYDDNEGEYLTDGELIYDIFRNKTDITVSNGQSLQEPSTVIDMTTQEYKIIRQGIGQWTED